MNNCNCVSCGKENLSKDEIGLTKNLFLRAQPPSIVLIV